VRIAVVRPGELGPAEIAAWHAMQGQTPALANPFLSPEFAIAAGRLRSAAWIAIITEGQHITGFFPFERHALGAGVPIAWGLTDCQGLVHAPGAHWDARALLKACGISAWQFDHLAAGQQGFSPYQAALHPSPVMDLSGGFAAYQAALRATSPSLLSGLGRKERKLAREAGDVCVVTDEQDASALRTLMGWKSDQYRRTGRLDRFSQPWIIELIDSLHATSGTGLRGLLSVLYAGGKPVAAHFGLQAGPILSYWFPAYDVTFARYSPGLILQLKVAEEAATAGVQLIDLGKGKMRYKESTKSRDLFVAEGIVTSRSPLGVAHWAHRVPQARVIRQIRTSPALFHAADTTLRRAAQIRGAVLGRVNEARARIRKADPLWRR
jgi:CelD/BcsL family acetyltransferase involved in cellulose biosynthesis